MSSMASKDERKLARLVVDLGRRMDAARAPQLPHTSVSLDDGTDRGITDGVTAAIDAYELAGTHDADLVDLSDIADSSVVESTFLPERLAISDSSADTGFDAALVAMRQISDTRVEIDEKVGAANERIEETRTDLNTAKDRIDETFGVATDAKTKAEQAVVSVVDEFAASSSATTAPETGWGLTPPPPEPGVWVWKRTVEEIGDGTRRIGLPAMLTGPEGSPGAAGADAALLRISSSRGTSFKNNAIGTVLSVTVFLGALQIVNIEGLRAKFGPGAYLEWWWRREDDSGFGLISSSDDRLSQSGFALTISPADVDEQTIFQCIMHT